MSWVCAACFRWPAISVYVLMQTRKRVILVDATGGMYKEQIEGLTKGDVLLSISMAPYGPETTYCTELAVEARSDRSGYNRQFLVADFACRCRYMTVHEAEAYYFRAMACTMSIAQALFIALAYRLEQVLKR